MYVSFTYKKSDKKSSVAFSKEEVELEKQVSYKFVLSPQEMGVAFVFTKERGLSLWP